MADFQAMQQPQNGWTFDPGTNTYTNPTTGAQMNQDSYNNYNADQQQKQQAAQEAAAAAAHHQQMAAQNMNDDGSPIRQAFDSLVDPSTGKLKDGYTMNISGLDPSQWQGYSKYKNEALRTGPSQWANLQTQQNNAAALANKESAARQADSGMNMGLSSLAMRGGLSDGARDLAARSSGRDLLMARQQAARAGDTANMQTSTTDEGNRVQQLGALASSEQNIGQYNKTLEGKQQEFNIQNLLQEQQGKRAYNDTTYSEQMKKWAAGKTADATAASGHGGKK